MKAKIKDQWVECNYTVNSMNIGVVKAELMNMYHNVTYLGKSKCYMDEKGVVHILRSRYIFFMLENLK